MANIFIVGLAHGVQTTSGACSSSQKEQYADFITRIIEQYRIDFVAEEWEPSNATRTIAQELVKPPSRWQPIDLSTEDKRRLGVPRSVPSSPQPPALDDGDSRTQIVDGGFQTYVASDFVSVEWRTPQDDARDQHMFDRVIEQSGNQKNILVLCGFNHLTQLAKKFREAKHSVKECDSLIEVLYGTANVRVRFPL
jgi:hypothetical protein